MKQYHVVPVLKRRRWAVRLAHGKRTERVWCGAYGRKTDAVAHGRKLAKKAKGQLVIHKRDGTIQTEHTYGKDPFPPRG